MLHGLTNPLRSLSDKANGSFRTKEIEPKGLFFELPRHPYAFSLLCSDSYSAYSLISVLTSLWSSRSFQNLKSECFENISQRLNRIGRQLCEVVMTINQAPSLGKHSDREHISPDRSRGGHRSSSATTSLYSHPRTAQPATPLYSGLI